VSERSANGRGPRLAFRAARAADTSFLADLAREAFRPYGDYTPVIEAWAADPRVEVTIAEQDKAPVGAAFLVFVQLREDPDTKVADLIALAVAAPFRGRGLGAALLGHVVDRARDVARRHGVPALRLTVAEGNTSARRLFEAAGFRYDQAEGSYPGGQKALHMSLPLPARGPAAG
jgi:ribosomal protein S18 acetylase RimI-like enzyme